MEFIKTFVKKNWFFILIFFFAFLRFLLSYKIPSFFASNLFIDDTLMVNQSSSLYYGKYLGSYSSTTLIKGMMFPLILFYIKSMHLTYSTGFTILYLLATIFFTYSLSHLTKNKIQLLIVYVFLLFNPITFSSEVFQRLYGNTISIMESLFFFGLILQILCAEKNNIYNYVFLGLITAAMYLTRDDNIWAAVILGILFIIKLYKNFNPKNILVNCIPVFVLVLCLHAISFVNYHFYGVYTYSELDNSYFKDAFTKVLQIKDDEKIDKVAIPKTTFYKLCDASQVMGCTKDDVDRFYNGRAYQNNEILNTSVIWYFRSFTYNMHQFQNGKEANNFYKKLSEELDELFRDGKLEKEFALPTVFSYMPTKNEVKQFPKDLVYALWYISSYKNIKTYNEADLRKLNHVAYNDFHHAYHFPVRTSKSIEIIIQHNDLLYEIIRIIYKYFTIIFSVISFVIYFMNIKKIDKRNIFLHIIVLTYLMILFGVVYTHTTAFHAIRYRYLCNVYILQSLFILLNLGRLLENKRGK